MMHKTLLYAEIAISNVMIIYVDAHELEKRMQ